MSYGVTVPNQVRDEVSQALDGFLAVVAGMPGDVPGSLELEFSAVDWRAPFMRIAALDGSHLKGEWTIRLVEDAAADQASQDAMQIAYAQMSRAVHADVVAPWLDEHFGIAISAIVPSVTVGLDEPGYPVHGGHWSVLLPIPARTA